MHNDKKFSNEQKEEITTMKEKTKDVKLYKKLEVLEYAARGYKNREISGLTGYSLSRVSDFVSEYIENGAKYFEEEQRKGGNRRNLTDEEEKKIIEEFTEKAVAGRVVSLNDMKKEYERVRGKETANSTFYGFLERMGWRRVMPRGQHPKKASNEAIEASKKLTIG